MIAASSLLSLEAMRAAYREGLQRFDANVAKGRKHRFDPNDPNLRPNNGEARVAEVLGKTFLGLPFTNGLMEIDSNAGDCPGWEIRWNDRRPPVCRVYPDERLELRYLLVSGRAPNQALRGWIAGADGRDPRWWKALLQRPGWEVPVDALRALSEIGDCSLRSGRSRMLVCRSCGEEVEVFEEPVEFIDPERFRCAICCDPRNVELLERQTSLLELPKPRRTQTVSYDPQQAAIPF